VAVSHRVVAVNASLPTFMRAPGEASGNFALESAMDELAAALHMDPIALRLRNYAEEDEHQRKPFASKLLRECYAQGADVFGWHRRTSEPRSMRDGRFLIGMGMATSTYPTNRQPASARVRLFADGTAVAMSGTQDLGTGTYTVMAQVAAEELGLPIGRVRFALGDSRLPAAPTSGGSQTVASVAPAVQAAARAVRDKVLAMALADPRGRFRGADRAMMRLRDGAVSGPGGRISIAELLAHRNLQSVEATAGAKPGAEAQAYSMHAFGAQFAEIRIDEDTGEMRLSRLVGAFDTGRVLNAKTARSQLLGGIVFGIGMALFEQTLVDGETGRVANANLSDYLLPVNADVPEIEVMTVGGDDGISNPLGAKGIGELPMVGVAAAIANAVWHASGVRVRSLPIRIENLLGA
ncbi:MAG TPA: molybdopterin cofactor-binding domain-containing protein, partial [Acetobacteraceae bacterium]|nr:molybdopterin cofactor-binding domain-containing protein [Acetobacteraceae bacterium]